MAKRITIYNRGTIEIENSNEKLFLGEDDLIRVS